MGVPALFRFLSKKYPKVISQVVEEVPKQIHENGEAVTIPIQYESANPNGQETDNLYLDMNGIVHPCTHPEGRPAPETEAEMMVEVFKYTERVVNMARPRKVLFMAIDGVAPRAKMNQQRSRRFRAAQEAQEKENEFKEAARLWESMGHQLSNQNKDKKPWDSNAITPGTPFMDLLSASLKYWVSQKLSTDPGWKNLKVIISDASVPGEGEHKIVDWIRRQRTHPDWDANTNHVIYGLDADLIMLALATHEPNFRVLREDVFAQTAGGFKPQACNNCGKSGHIRANCKQPKKLVDPTLVQVAKPVDPKPFIWLDVRVLREYLRYELDVPGVGFPYHPEIAIDDWVFLIFFVGNDFLPHLPSLEIREGAIEKLLDIWRQQLPKMGGYLTNNGKVNLERCQYILDAVAVQEDGIFQNRKRSEEQMKNKQARRRREEYARQDKDSGVHPKKARYDTMTMNGQEYEQAMIPNDTARGGRLHPSLPQRPGAELPTRPEADAPAQPPRRPGKKLSYAEQAASLKLGLEAMSGSNLDIVKNRKAIRMANISAAEALKAELEGDGPPAEAEATTEVQEDEVMKEETAQNDVKDTTEDNGGDDMGDESLNVDESIEIDESLPHGTKRTRKDAEEEDEQEEDDEEQDEEEDELSDAPANPADLGVPRSKLKVNPDGTVDYEDTVKLWEPGYRNRYYQQKFGIDLPNDEFLAKITRSYMEGLCWVLEYYYQGVPAWDWFYPYHHAPFAADFHNVGEMKIKFPNSIPFTPYGQLLGVFPAASRKHLPAPLQTLMVDKDSPIIDFYPEDFEIDMNGKAMFWQGIALLPFIDQKRLLDALDSKVDELTPDEKRRNKWGDNVMFFSDEHDMTPTISKELYGVKAQTKQVPLDTTLSHGIAGSVLADPSCVPHARMETPLPSIPGCPDLNNNHALSVRYYFPRQAHRHCSVILKGYKKLPPVLNDNERRRAANGSSSGGDRSYGGGPGGSGGRGGRGRGGGAFGGGPGRSGGSAKPMRGPQPPPRDSYGGGGGGGRYGGYGGPPPQNPYGAPPPTAAYGGGGYGGGGSGGGGYGGGGYGGSGYGGSGYGGSGYGGGGSYNQPPSRYGAPPSSYGPPPPGYGAGGYGGGSGSGSYGGSGYGNNAGGRGGYGGNPYSGRGAPPRRY